MSIEEGPIVQETPAPESQLPASPVGQKLAEPELDDAAVRAAIANAEANNVDPTTLKTSEISQTQPAKPEEPKLEIPAKFLKPDGEVDVEKLQASTRQLDEANQKKEAELRSIDEYMKKYRELEIKNSQLPNPDKLKASLPELPEPINPNELSDQQLEEMVNRDIEANPGRTFAKMLEIALAQKFAPIEQEKKLGNVRQNIQELASRDPRILKPEVFAAVNAKLDTWKVEDPARLHLKNPHKAAWLEVKEELRLGDLPARTDQAQPSRPPSPVLGGGTPPSTPSSSATQFPRSADELSQLDPRDRNQEAKGDEMMRRLLSRER